MNYIILIIIGIAGIIIGRYLAVRKMSPRVESSDCVQSEQSKKKAENKEGVLRALSNSREGRITNNEVERLLGVSNATAERYLDELEKEGKLIQHGEIGPNVFYTLK